MEDIEAERHAVAAAAFLGFPLPPGRVAGVAANLQLLAVHAARFMDQPSPPWLEPAPVFDPGSPE
ncbi:DUF4089 domain-containing protein [Rhizosaccharibacter radicis]|uniref:DUF4089 domain-containing protein n=1 Tax=Rhizosaccharibacter radicis TaxID=2782605 RepID=A0ABT1VXF8_9PROT|nr:DUF4089 domain-containing protein [Acetobacteraceae bacterium KSS12]